MKKLVKGVLVFCVLLFAIIENNTVNACPSAFPSLIQNITEGTEAIAGQMEARIEPVCYLQKKEEPGVLDEIKNGNTYTLKISITDWNGNDISDGMVELSDGERVYDAAGSYSKDGWVYLVDAPGGVYQLTLSAPGYETLETTIIVSKDATFAYKLRLHYYRLYAEYVYYLEQQHDIVRMVRDTDWGDDYYSLEGVSILRLIDMNGDGVDELFIYPGINEGEVTLLTYDGNEIVSETYGVNYGSDMSWGFKMVQVSDTEYFWYNVGDFNRNPSQIGIDGTTFVERDYSLDWEDGELYIDLGQETRKVERLTYFVATIEDPDAEKLSLSYEDTMQTRRILGLEAEDYGLSAVLSLSSSEAQFLWDQRSGIEYITGAPFEVHLYIYYPPSTSSLPEKVMPQDFLITEISLDCSVPECLSFKGNDPGVTWRAADGAYKAVPCGLLTEEVVTAELKVQRPSEFRNETQISRFFIP